MKIIHKSQKRAVEKNLKEDVGLMISNGAGSYFARGIKSRYCGFFCYIGDEMYRILDSIDSFKTEKIAHNQWSVDCIGRSNQARFFMPEGYAVLVRSLKKAEKT